MWLLLRVILNHQNASGVFGSGCDKADLETKAVCACKAVQGFNIWTLAPTLKPRDSRLRRRHALRNLRLGQAGARPQLRQYSREACAAHISTARPTRHGHAAVDYYSSSAMLALRINENTAIHRSKQGRG